MSRAGDGTGESDLTILPMRQMLGAGEFRNGAPRPGCVPLD